MSSVSTIQHTANYATQLPSSAHLRRKSPTTVVRHIHVCCATDQNSSGWQIICCCRATDMEQSAGRSAPSWQLALGDSWKDICLAEAAASSDTLVMGAVYKYTHSLTHSLTHSHTLRFNGHFPGEPGSAGCPLILLHLFLNCASFSVLDVEP